MNDFSQRARNVAIHWFGDGPWRSKSVLVALAVVATGLAFWLSDIKPKPVPNNAGQTTTDAPKIMPLDDHWNWSRPFPVYMRMSASYVAAYCLGWLFRRMLRLIVVVSVLIIALLAYGKFVGWDTTRTEEKVKQGAEWTRQTATTEKDRLKRLLPSATAGAVGMFMGFWRRNKIGAIQSEQSPGETR